MLPVNSAESRRELRGDIERASLATSRRYRLELLGRVRDGLEAVERDIEQIGTACHDMQQLLDQTQASTQLLKSQAAMLQQDQCVI